ncbi:MAG: ferredoxin [Hyphomicrobiaceae bacterium]|jgi:ferredoxin
MKIKVDYDLCEANAVCMKVVPQVFKVDDNDELQILDENPSEDLRPKLDEAVRRCPRQALALED